MARILASKGNAVYASDLNSHGFGETGIDFLTSTREIDNIVTNPPFNIAENFVAQGLKLANKKFILLLRLAFLESASRYENIFSKSPPSRVLVFSQRLSMYPEGQEVKGGGTTSYGWFVWDKSIDSSAGTSLKWIPPGFKPKNSRPVKPKVIIDELSSGDTKV